MDLEGRGLGAGHEVGLQPEVSGGVDVDGAEDGEDGGPGEVAPHLSNAVDFLGRSAAEHGEDSGEVLFEEGVGRFAWCHIAPHDPLDGAVCRGKHADRPAFGIDDGDTVRRGSELGPVPEGVLALRAAAAQRGLLATNHDQTRGGAVSQCNGHDTVVHLPHDSACSQVSQLDEADDQLVPHNAYGLVGTRQVLRGWRAAVRVGVESLRPQVEAPRHPSPGVEELHAHQRLVVGHQRIADRSSQKVQALKLAGPLSEPARAPLEGPRGVVAPQFRGATIRDHDVAVAQTHRGHDFAELVLQRAGHGADLDDGLRVDPPGFVRFPERGDGGDDGDAGGVSV